MPSRAKTPILDVRVGDWIRTRDEDMDTTNDPILDEVVVVNRRAQTVETWHGQTIPFEDIQEVRHAD